MAAPVGPEADGALDPFVPQIYDPDSLDGLKLSVSWGLNGIARQWDQALDERLKFARQTPPRWRVLAWAQLIPGIKQAQLAEKVRITGPTLVRILDSLEDQGMIERREHAPDRRVKEIWLTPEAGPIIRAISQEAKMIRDILLRDLPEEELRGFLSVLGRIRDRMAELRRSDAPED